MSDPIVWATMTFDPELQVNVHEMIRVMRGEVSTLTADQWLDARECVADILEQFIEQRLRIEELKGAVRMCNEELAKAYEHSARYQRDAMDLAARLIDARK